MRILLDECLDWRLGRDIAGHEVKTARQMGWAGIKNGELLRRATGAFDIFVTVDRNLPYQQRIGPSTIAIVILRAKTNSRPELKLLVPRLLTVIPSAKPGSINFVDA